MRNKDSIAEDLINWHFEVEPGLVLVYRVITENEDAPGEPIKLIEVNSQTVSAGRFSAFGFAPTKEVPYPTLIAEVTPDELEDLRSNGVLPEGWDMSHARAYQRPAA